MPQLNADLFTNRYQLVDLHKYTVFTYDTEFFPSPAAALEFFQKNSHTTMFSHWENPHIMEVVKKISTVKPAKKAVVEIVSPAEPGEYTIAPLMLTPPSESLP